MNDTEEPSWLKCDGYGSWYLGGWAFHPGTRCTDIAHTGDLKTDVACDSVLLEVAEWKRLH